MENSPKSPLYPILTEKRLASILETSYEDLEEISSQAGSFYSPFDQRNIGSAKWRHIDRPMGKLRSIQGLVQSRLFGSVTLPDGVLGGIKGADIIQNAAHHSGKSCVVNLDIRNCFPSTSNLLCFRAIKSAFGTTSSIAALLTKLVTLERRVPQGAPTSTAIVNIVLAPMFKEIWLHNLKLGLNTTIWIDDITISGDGARAAIEPTIRTIQRFGYAVRVRKTIVMSSGSSQTVTSIQVNEEPNVGRSYVQGVRNQILQIAQSGEVSRAELESVEGKIRHVRRVNRNRGSNLLVLLKEKLYDLPVVEGELKRRERRPCARARRHSCKQRAQSY